VIGMNCNSDSLPLKGLRVIDLTRLLPGPHCTMLMGDYGADVIKIEDTDVGDPTRFVGRSINGSGSFFRQINRNKRSMAINLKCKEGQEVICRLAAKADVLVEGFRPGVMKRLDLHYDRLSRINSRLIYASISGYGQEGRYRERAGHDLNYTALTGLLDLSADDSRQPVMPAVQIADIAAGSLMALNGILMALYKKEKYGKGNLIDISMTRGLLPWMVYAVSAPAEGDDIPRRNSGHITGAYACYNLYSTADEKYMSLGALEPVFWQRFCQTVNHLDWIKRQFERKGRLELIEEVRKLFRTKTRLQWEAIFAEIDACCEPVLTLKESVDHPLSVENNYWIKNRLSDETVELMPGFPLIFSGCSGKIHLQPPKHGEHTKQILEEHDYKKTEIKWLQENGVIKDFENKND
jgi:crotonobetainyl-CoA:carnitine CoA-transferase CaiB-like acyl-CoA transferase